MRNIRIQVVLILVVILFVAGCSGKNIEESTSIKNLEVMSSTGYHATSDACVLDNLLAIPITNEVVCINANDGVPFWKYTTTIDKAWTLTWVVSGNNQFLAGYEAGNSYKVVRLSRDKTILEIVKSETEASKPIWIDGKWWRMTANDFFTNGVEFEIPESYPDFIYTGELLIHQTVDGILQARRLDGSLVWGWSSGTHITKFFDMDWGIATLSESTFYLLNPETGERLWEKEGNIIVEPQKTNDGMLVAIDNIIKKLDKEGNEIGIIQTPGRVIDMATANDGIAVLIPSKLITFDNEFKMLEEKYLNPKINEVFVYPGDFVAVSGYSQVFFKTGSKTKQE